MSNEPKQSDTAKRESQIGFDPDAACEGCGQFGAYDGQFGAYDLGGRKLCENCYAGCGSCCPEFGKDDLWTFGEPKENQEPRTSLPGKCR